jgi:nucleoside-diphosphate-sugar epimerase
LNKRITVTGGKGFLGKHLIKHLQEKGYKSIDVADLPEYNLVRIGDVQGMYETTKPDIVIHLAAKVGGIGFNQQNPASLFYENAMMGIQLLHEGYIRKIQKFVALGTICAYPKFTPVPFKEADLWNGYPEETNAPYGLAKKMMLVQSQAYRQQYGFNSIFLLPVNLYGPGDNFSFKSSHVIPALIRKFHLANLLSAGDYAGIIGDFQINKENEFLIDGNNLTVNKDSSPETICRVLKHFGIYLLSNSIQPASLQSSVSPLPSVPSSSRFPLPSVRSSSERSEQSSLSSVVEVWGTGKATREFFYVDDAAEAIVLAMERYNKGEPVNIGAGFEISIKDLLYLIVELTAFKGRVVWDNTKPDGQPRRMLDTSRAFKEFGFEATTGFPDGLQKTIEWYRKHSCF